MRIVLIGYRGSGKTSIGRAVAGRLGLDFADVDEATCAKFAMDSIAAIWERFGEPQWRRREAEAAIELCGRDNVVIGLGGGTPMIDNARAAIKQCDALRIYLKASPDVLCDRIHRDPATGEARPNLTQLGGGIDEIAAVLAKREPTYQSVADAVVDVGELNVEQAAERIVALAEAGA